MVARPGGVSVFRPAGRRRVPEDFDRVVFYGAGAAGYAAAAYSITAPQAELVLIAPRATLDPGLAGWDERHRIARRINFRGPVRLCAGHDGKCLEGLVDP